MPNGDNSKAESYCARCDSSFKIPGARFCPACGAQLQPRSKAGGELKSQLDTRKLGDKTLEKCNPESCMICQEHFEEADYVAWCPFCGNAAHKMEFEKWLRTNKRCPSCKESFTESQLQDATLSEAGFSKEDNVIHEVLVHRGHLLSLKGMRVLYDGEEVSRIRGGSWGLYKSAFKVEEQGKPVQYDLLFWIQQRHSAGVGMISGLANTVLWASGANKRIKFAVLRNGKTICNQGIPIKPSSQTMKEIMAVLKSSGIEAEQEIQHCPRCGVENTILDPFFCACCGAILGKGSEIAGTAIGKDGVDRNKRTCFMCNKGLLENLRKGETIAWCPFCGKAAHTRCFYEALKKEPKCPACGNTYLADDLVRQLKKRKKK